LPSPPLLVHTPSAPPLTQAIEFSLFEEAFEIFKKFGKKVDAIQVLLTHLQDLDRAHEYANKVRGGAVSVPFGGRVSDCVVLWWWQRTRLREAALGLRGQ
jgi:hypothetical protein